MTDKVFEAFLADQQVEAMALAADSDILELRPFSERASRRYIATFNARGLSRRDDSEVVEVDRGEFAIRLPDDYLRRAEAIEVLTFLGPFPSFHPNIKTPLVCVHLAPSMGLVDVIYACHELWTWTLYYTGDEGLDHAAAQWARNQNPSRFPIDPRPLKRRSLAAREVGR